MWSLSTGTVDGTSKDMEVPLDVSLDVPVS